MLRVIDDYSVFGHSDTTIIPEKVLLGGLDVVVSIVRLLMQSFECQVFSVTLAGGTVPYSSYARAIDAPSLLPAVHGRCVREWTVSIGGIIFDDKKGIAAFGFSIDEHFLSFWKRKGRTQLIGLLEVLPVLVAKMVYADFLTDASPCGFIDNEGARANLINGYSPDIDTGNMLSINAQFDAELGCLPWWARVPTAGNPADAPSTLDFSALSMYGNVQLRNEAHVAQYL